ncbi:hypothetical protein MMC30_008040 [Trapelia coarctata]|nr:hypothetical protein [Trapelia coarctata]
MAIIGQQDVYQTLLGVSALYIVYYTYWQLTTGARRRRMIKEHGCKPVNRLPSWDPLFGLDIFLQTLGNLKNKNLLATTQSRFREMGVTTFQLKLVGQDIYMTVEPENLKTVMSLQFKNFGLGSRRISSFLPLLGEGIFTTDGAAWQHSREMLRPNFVRSQVGDLAMFETHVNHLIQAIPRDGSTVDLAALFFRLTMDSATEFLFGESTNCLAPGVSTEKSAAFAGAFNRSQEAVGNQARSGGMFAFFFKDRQLEADIKTVHAFVDDFVQKGFLHKQAPDAEKAEGRYVFLHALVKQTDNKVQIRSELLNILLAGRDTTASLLSNVWWEISKRPDVWAKLRAEVDALGGQKPTFEQIKDMKYLRAVLNESLRLYPVVPGNSREALTDTILPLGGGPTGHSPLFIAKGTLLAWSLYTMHRRPEYYGPSAEEFRPERWETLRPGWEYLPFNGGPRICIGQQFALMEAAYTTVRVMQEFQGIESRDTEPWQESLTLTCTGLNGAKVSLTPF